MKDVLITCMTDVWEVDKNIRNIVQPCFGTAPDLILMLRYRFQIGYAVKEIMNKKSSKEVFNRAWNFIKAPVDNVSF